MDRGLPRLSYVKWSLVACCALFGCARHQNTSDHRAPTTQPVTVAEPWAVDEFAEVQARKGALVDATIYRGHFDGDRLNSLGRSKLALLARDHEAGHPVVVHVDLSDGRDAPPARQDAIRQFLASAGVPADDVRIESGPNPANPYPAAAAIQGLRKTDSDYRSAQTTEAATGTRGGMTPTGDEPGSR